MTGIRARDIVRKHASTVGISQAEALRLLALLEHDILLELTSGNYISFAGIRLSLYLEEGRKRYNVRIKGVSVSRPRVRCLARLYEATQKKLKKLIDS